MWSWLTGSPAKSTQVVEAEKCFSKEELKHLGLQFKAAADSDSSHQHAGSISAMIFLGRICGLPPSEPVAQALLDAVRRGRALEQGVTLEDIVVAKARLERMGEEDATSFCHQVLMSAAAKQALAKQPALAHSECTPLQHGLTACSRLVLGAPAPASLISAIASGAMAHARPDSSGSGGNGPGASAPVEFTVDVYRRWVKAWPAVQELLGSLLKGAGLLELQRVVEPGAGPGKPTNVIKPPTGISSVAARSQDRPPWMPACPALAEVGRPGQQPLLLKPLFAWMLSSCMTTDLRHEWRCTFNSDRDGKSFNTLIARMGAFQGPSLLLVRDKAGHVFGGYAPAPWAKQGTFYGDASTFIFSLQPSTQIFRATGANKNYQWCGVGFRELPNGVGFGGPDNAAHVGHFALFVDSTCDQGMSRPIATFGTVASLASEQVFQVDTVECWQLRLTDEEEEAAAAAANPSKNKSILDKSAQDRTVLTMAGVNVNHSAGLRDEPIEE